MEETPPHLWASSRPQLELTYLVGGRVSGTEDTCCWVALVCNRSHDPHFLSAAQVGQLTSLTLTGVQEVVGELS